MAVDDDNTTQLNDTTPTQEETQPWDADLPVDPDSEETNAGVAKGLDKKKVVVLGVVVGFIIVVGIAIFSLSKKPTTPDNIATGPVPTEPTPAGVPGKVGKMPVPPKAATSTSPQTAPVNPNEVVTGALKRPAGQDWVKGVTKPLPVPNGLEATPGQPGSNTPQVKVIKPAVGATPTNSKDAAMKRLWDQGAQAKHRGDYAAARKAWKTILELDPHHAGIQEAINKLPR
jgi:hypothetical protein